MTPSLHVTIAEQRAGDSSRCCCSWRSDILFPVSSRPLVSPGVRYVHGRLQSDGGLSSWRSESGRKGATNRRQHHQTVSRRGKTLCESMSAVCKPQRFKPQLCVCVFRTKRIFKQLGMEDFSSVNVQVLGAEDTYGANARTKVTDSNQK